MKKNIIALCGQLLVVVMMLTSKSAFAEDCPADINAVTAEDAAVPVEVLAHKVKPLTRCELEAEAQAWLLILQAKVTEISNAEVAALYKKEEIKKAEKVEDALKEVQEAKQEADSEEAKEATKEAREALKEAKEVERKSVQDVSVQEAIKAAETKAKEEGEPVVAADITEAKADIKTALIKHVTDLMLERTALIDRFKVVLAELTAKGGVAGSTCRGAERAPR